MKVYSNIDINQNEIQNVVLHKLSSPPTTPILGQLYYDTVLGSAFFWNGAIWVPMSGSASADNGLTKIGNTIKLGGSLTQNTVLDFVTYKLVKNGIIEHDSTISGMVTAMATLDNTLAIGAGDDLDLDNGAFKMASIFFTENISTSVAQLITRHIGADTRFVVSSNTSQSTITVTSTDTLFQGILYTSNWDANLINDSLVPKRYVDNLVSTTLTANNGLTKIGNNIKLGGSLTQNTYLDGNFVVSFGSGGVLTAFAVYTDVNIQLQAISGGNTSFLSATTTYAAITTTDSTTSTGVTTTANVVNIVADNGINQLNVNLYSVAITVAGNGTNNNFVVQDDISSKGIVYSTDYSANFTNESLVSKRYVDTLVNGVIYLPQVLDVDLKNDSLNTPPIPVSESTYIVGPTPTGAWLGLAGHVVYWNGSTWISLLGRPVITGDRFGVLFENVLEVAGGGLTGKEKQIVEIVSAIPGAITYTFTIPVNKNTVYNTLAINSPHYGDGYTFNGTNWIEFVNITAYQNGPGLTLSSTVFAVDQTKVPYLASGFSTGLLKWNGASWVFDNSAYLTGNQTITLSGEASGSGATSIFVTLNNSAVINKVLTGYLSGAGVISASDSILSAIQKLNGNIGALITGVSSFNLRTGAISLTLGDVTGALGYIPYNSTNPSNYLTSNQTITFTASGDISGTTTGSTSLLPTLTLATISQAASGSFVKITLDTKGRVVGNTPVSFSDITGALGYTPYNSTNPSNYLTSNQTITLSGDITGSGTTAITTTIANLAVTNAMIANSTIDLTVKVTGVLPITNGGTGTSTTFTTNNIVFAGASGIYTQSNNFTYTPGTTILSLTGTNPGINLSAVTTTPAAPAAGNLLLYTQLIANRISPIWIAPSGTTQTIQSSLYFGNTSIIGPGGSTTPFVMNVAITNVGTVSHPTPTLTNLKSQTRRFTLTSAAVAGSLASTRVNVLECWRGTSADWGGFFIVARFALTTLQVGNRGFIGLTDTATTAPTNIDPLVSTTPGKVGMAFNLNTGNWFLVNNITSIAPTTLDLGANFSINTTDFLELVLFSRATDSNINYKITNLTTGISTSGTLTTNIPNSSTFLGRTAWMTNNATAASVAFDIAQFSLETNY